MNSEAEKTPFDELVLALHKMIKSDRYSVNYIRKRLKEYPEKFEVEWCEYLLKVLADDSFEDVQPAALELLAKSRSKWPVIYICEAWATTRHNGLEELLLEKEWVAGKTPKTQVLTALLNGQAIPEINLETLRALTALTSATGKDRGFIQPAKKYLAELDPAYLPLVETLWRETFAPVLLDLLIKQKYRPDLTTESGFWLALLLPEYETEILKAGAEIAGYLVAALNAEFPQLRERVAQLLPQISSSALQAELCKEAVYSEQPFIQHTALRKGWLPSDFNDRALFYFLTDQLAKYEELDFDGRILRLTYQAAKGPLRSRLAAKIKAFGKPEYLSMLTGGESKRRAKELTAQESEALVKVLTQTQNWQALWEIMPLVTVAASIKAVRTLTAQLADGWQPGEDTAKVLKELYALTEGDLLTDPLKLANVLPLVLPLSKVRLDFLTEPYALAFSPKRPLLALGGEGKVTLWNWQLGTVEEVIECGASENKFIQALAFTPDDTLWLAGSPTSRESQNTIYRWKNQQLETIGYHSQKIALLETLGENYVVSVGRDRKLAVWYTESGKLYKDCYTGGDESYYRYYFPSRSLIAISPDQTLLLSAVSSELYSLPDLNLLSSNPPFENQPFISNVWFVSPTEIIFENRSLYSLKIRQNFNFDDVPLKHDKFQLRDNISYVGGNGLIPKSNYRVFVDKAGILDIFDWEAYQLIGNFRLGLPDKVSVTSYQVSPDGTVLVVRDGSGQLQLLDLSPLLLRRIFELPLAALEFSHLAAITATVDKLYNPPLQKTLRYVEAAVKLGRLRYAIEVDELPVIHAGEFDIELD